MQNNPVIAGKSVFMCMNMFTRCGCVCVCVCECVYVCLCVIFMFSLPNEKENIKSKMEVH